MSNQNTIWVVQKSDKRTGPWKNVQSWGSRDTAREYAKDVAANYTRVRKYIDSNDKT